jgi:predicted RecB family nuclease
MNTGLSKSRFLAGQQCDLRLWYAVNERHLASPPGAVQESLFATGTAVGELARARFPGGVLIDDDHMHGAEAVAATTRVLDDGAVPAIYEGGFEFEGVLVRVDVLVRRADGGWNLVEVKSGTRVKEEHDLDVAIQVWVLRGAGVDVRCAGVVVLNRDYEWSGGDYDLDTMFQLHDRTTLVEGALPEISSEVARLHSMLAGDDGPRVVPGPQCHTPYECPFFEHCSKDLVEPQWPLSVLPSLKGRRLQELEAMGLEDVREVPDDFALTPIQGVVRAAVLTGTEQIHGDLAAALSEVVYPVHYLDFESANPALPRWPGTHPYDAIPFQFSIHTQQRDGTVEHSQYLHADPSDPRERLAVAMIEALGHSGSIVVYSSYEQTVIKALARALPDLASRLEDLVPRIFDLLPVVRGNYYHPGFMGSFSMKSVLPVLVPELSYDDLEIGEGSLAAMRYLQALDSGNDVSREAIFTALREYCGRDTMGLLRIHRELELRASQST